MKNRKSARIVILTLFVVLILGMTFALGTSAEDDTELKPQIISQNIEYSKDFRLMYAVDASSVTGPVELRVYATYPTKETEEAYIKKYKVSEITPASETGNLGRDAYIFITDGVSYTGMADNFYVQAIDIASGARSEVKRYSVAEYLYERLSNPESTEIQKNLYKSTIQFGTDMQKALNNEIDESKLISNLRYVVVDGGTVGGYKTGLYAVGEDLTPTAQGVAKWNVSYISAGGVELKKYEGVSTLAVPSIEGVVKLNFSAGKRLSYDEASDDLEAYADWDALQSAIMSGVTGAPTAELVQDTDHGNVGKVSFTSGQGLKFNTLYSGISSEYATAYVASFDMKVNASNMPETNTRASAELKFTDANGNKRVRIQLWVVNDSGTAKPGLANEGNGAGGNYYTINTAEWFNIKIVQYEGDKNVYVFVGGDTDNPLTVENTITYMAENDYAVDDIEHVQLLYGNWMDGVDFYFDNVFFGFTDETVPEPPQTPVKSTPDDLENYANWETLQSALISSTSAATGSLAYDPEKGNVGAATFTEGGYLRFNKFNTGVSSTDATAFAASFDLKIDAANRPEEDAAKSASVDLKFRDSSANQWLRIQLQVIKKGETTQIGLGHDSNWATDGKWYTAETTEWVTVKVIQYEGDRNIYLYIGNDTENPVTVVNQKTVAVDSNYTIDDLSYVDIGWGNNMKGIDVYFDNVFFGFTAEAAPSAQ